MSDILRIGVIGDLHGSWDDGDTRYFDASDYALLLFTGDLGSGTSDNGVHVARTVGRLAKPALIMPGNNDVRLAAQIAAELAHQRGLHALRHGGSGLGLGSSSEGARLCGYSLHPLQLGDRVLTVLAARPYAMGGSELSFPDRLRENFEIASMEASRERLCTLIDRAPSDEIVVLAHNGPCGLGSRAVDPWGCDFRTAEGDWGDSDLTSCIEHAKARGKRVRAVVAGHMHWPTRSQAPRTWQRSVDGTLYVNAARVPRTWEDARGKHRCHVSLELRGSETIAREVIATELG